MEGPAYAALGDTCSAYRFTTSSSYTNAIEACDEKILSEYCMGKARGNKAG